jgi:hypothetical protein
LHSFLGHARLFLAYSLRTLFSLMDFCVGLSGKEPRMTEKGGEEQWIRVWCWWPSFERRLCVFRCGFFWIEEERGIKWFLEGFWINLGVKNVGFERIYIGIFRLKWV